MADQPLNVLEQLGDELERIAVADERRTRRHAARRRPRRRTALLSLLVATVVSGVAIAASGLLEPGTPVREPLWATMNPDAGTGTPVPGSDRLTELRVPDPDGGPPWGIRTLRTSNGFGCVQVGRVVGGRLGVLGTDGAFGGDGRFHPLPAGQLTQAHCEQPDDAGHTFLAISARGLPASGYVGGCHHRGSTPVRPGDGPACAKRRLRMLYFGLLGPRARAVTYRDDRGRVVEAPTARGTGAYLVVVRPDRRRPAEGGYVPAVSPGSGLTSVEYDGAPTCRIRSPRSLGGAKACPMVGRVERPLPKLTSADVAAPIRVDRPAGADAATITFRARVAVDGRRRAYVAGVRHRADGRHCVGGGSSGPLSRPVRAGQLVTMRVGGNTLCPGAASGIVLVADVVPGQQPFAMPGIPTRDPVVGRFRLPPR